MTTSTLSVLPLWILLLPLFGFLFNALAYPLAAGGTSKTHPGVAGSVASLFMGASFVLALLGYGKILGGADALHQPLYDWIHFGELKFSLALHLDPLSSMMTLIITGIGSLIHIYSIAYMSHEKGVSRFFAYLNLFCFAMLFLVLSDSLLGVFFGWEGVGLCSYLLISYWYSDEANVQAARKAFLANRVGDLGFVLAMALIYTQMGTLSFAELIAGVSGAAVAPWLFGAAALLFFAATGKSAQLPLYVWLPDAMAGPTPVSALIHAATMVTAGVYLFVRMHVFFELAPALMSFVAWIGVVTALLGGTIALVQTDIKKLLAYSTVSQLGFMFIAVGVGAYQTAMFHLMTHAFFKALLFLGAGSVIHACDGEQDMRKMGGLAKALPWTHLFMLVGSAAIAGLPVFSGFFSKDEILYMTLAQGRGNFLLFGLACVAAFLTALYAIRLLTLTFWGPSHFKGHPHESPLLMTGPLFVLAVLATFGGFLGIPHEWAHDAHQLSLWLSPVVAVTGGHEAALSEALVSGFAVLISVIGLGLGYAIFRKNPDLKVLGLEKLWAAKYYLDEIYQAVLVRPLHALGALVERGLEQGFMFRLGDWMGTGVQWSGDRLRAIQNGDLQAFTLLLVTGLVLVLGILWTWAHI